MIHISYKDRDFTVEKMTEEDKEILKAEKPEIYKRFFKELIKEDSDKQIKNKVKNKQG